MGLAFLGLKSNDQVYIDGIVEGIARVRRPMRVNVIRWLVPTALGLLLLAIVVGGFTAWADHARVTGIGDLVTTVGGVVTAVAFSLGVWQWLAARHEASLDNYYERLDLANSRFDAAQQSRLKQPADAADLQRHNYAMFIFAELDNLEYVLEKHCRGYVEVALLARALRHFEERSRDAEFRAAMLSAVGRLGEAQPSGYTDRTREVARAIAARMSR